jgi:mutator protein MutT
MEEMRDIVDENDNVIATVTKKEMREKNLLHRGAVIIVFNSKGEIFVHKRTSTKDIYPSYYDLAVGGGVLAGETYEKATKRELKEEVGIENPELKFLFKARYKNNIDNLFANIYSCVYDGEIKLQEDEIEKGFFISIKELKDMMKKEKFCPEAIDIFRRYEKLKK